MADNDTLVYIVEGSGPNGSLQEGDDIKQETRERLGNYLSAKTKDPIDGNKYPVKSGINETSLRNPDGNPASIMTDGSGGENPYVTQQDDPQIDQYSNSGLFSDLDSFVAKGQTSNKPETAKDGHDLLRSVNGSNRLSEGEGRVIYGDKPSDSLITKKVSAMLKAKNRFDPSENTPFNTYASREQLATEQSTLGSYNRNASIIDSDRMGKVAMSLMLKATGEYFGTDDPLGAAGQLTTLVPGKTQLAIGRVPADDLFATNAFGAPDKTHLEDPTSAFKKDSVITGYSYGSYNNPYEPFDGLLPVGTTILAGALVVALKVAIEGFGAILNAAAGNDEPTGFPQILPLGVSNPKGNNDDLFKSIITYEMLGIRKTKFPFNQAYNKGIDVFFEFDGTSFLRVARSPGFYAVFVRSIIRSAYELTQKIASLSGNVVDVTNGVLGTLDYFRTSKIIGALNMFATLGDVSLTLESQGFKIGQKISTTDALPSTPATHVSKSREAGSTRLAWRNSSVNSLIMLPAEIMVADQLVNATPNATLAAAKMNAVRTTESRLSSDLVSLFEKNLNAEYVPFYFHDIRTNEIIAFHAFLESLTDNFTPSYESSQGYGRVEPIRTYKGTERAVNFSFLVTATNEDDFDVMWAKVNKLVTMVYPQWSPGEAITDKSWQPFSQTISGSPLIRLRIGDVITSNFSKFSLARIFGVGSNLTDDQKKKIMDQKVFDQAKHRIESLLSGNSKYGDGERALIRPGSSSKGFKQVPKANGIFDIMSSFIDDDVLSDWNPQNEEIVKVIENTSGNGSEVFYKVEFDNKNYLVPHGSLRPLEFEVLKDIPLTATMDSDELLYVKKLLSENNAIIRSFKTTEGRGLAGFITQLNFEWISASYTWDTRSNAKAPKTAKVTVAFAPTHDISPGIDHTGFNRAPLYNVGGIMNKFFDKKE